jgi:curved DNA-binding protein CbpA
MVTPDLYEILGVPRDAKAADIKNAFRRRAKDLHPDHGGDPESFRLLMLAYDVLSDPEQRLHYDQTGQTPEDRAAVEREEQAYRALVGDFIVNLIAHGAAPEFTDIVALAREQARQLRDAVEGQIGAMKMLGDRLASVRSRLIGGGEKDMLRSVLGERGEKLHQTIEDLIRQRSRWERLMRELEDYGYDVFVESVP